MAVSLTQLAQRLAAGAVLPADRLEQWQAAHPNGDAQSFVDEQLAAGDLTSYQAEALLAENPPPLVLGNYVILDRIGAGGMGQVFKARHSRMKRLAAIKILADKLTDSPEALDRFHREVEAAARLSHPNIVITHDADECDGVHYLVMEYVAGRDLATVVAEGGSLSVSLAVECIVQAARGLQYAHGQGIVHRDIKPSNLLLARSDSQQPDSSRKPIIKILDMGLARLAPHRPQFGEALSDGPALTAPGQVMGTIDYMSPEQAEDSHAVDHRADIYSLGCTLYRLLAGRPPYDGTTVMKKLLAHREEEIPSLRSERGDVTEALDAAFRKMIAKQPDDRFQSASELIDALLACQSELDGLGAEATVTEIVDAELTTTDAAEQTVDFGSSADPSPQQQVAVSDAKPAPGSTINHGETVAFPRGAPTSDTAPSFARSAPPPATPSGNTMALLGFGSGVVSVILSLLTGWIPCAGIAIVVLPVALALILGVVGRVKAAQGNGHGGKALTGMALGLLAVVATIALQFVGSSWVVKRMIDLGKDQFQREQQWWSFANVWEAPPENAMTDQLLPLQVNRFTRQSVDTNATVTRFNIDLPGRHAVYQSDDQRQEVYVWRASELEKEAIFSRIDDQIRDAEDDSGPSNISMSYGSPPKQRYRWVIDLPEDNKQVALFWGGDWLFLAAGDVDADGFLRTLLLTQMSMGEKQEDGDEKEAGEGE